MYKKILILVAVLVLIQLSVTVVIAIVPKENVDYVCIEKGNTAEPPPKIKNFEDNNFSKLCTQNKVPSAIYTGVQVQELNKKIKGAPNITLINSRKNNKDGSEGGTADCTSFTACYDWAFTSQSTMSTGVDAYLTQHDPEMDSRSYHSIAEIGISNTNVTWPGDYVETGWRKAVNDVTRLFTFFWIGGNGQCYNTQCKGWVQLSQKYYPGMPLGVNTNGIDYTIQYRYGSWWVWYNDEWIGYYPGSLWNNRFTQGNLALYYGEVASSVATTNTDMGNGLWASNPSSAKMIGLSFLNSSGWMPALGLDKSITSRNLYTLEPDPYFYPTNYIRYGGPGLNDLSSYIGLYYPSDGMTLETGYSYSISWSYEGSPGPYVKIELYKSDGTLVGTIANSVIIGDAGTGYYWWDLPLLYPPGDYKIKLISSTDPGIYWSENINPFHIKKGDWKISVVSPNGGEVWSKGTKKTIDWLFHYDWKVNIYLMKGGLQYSVLATNVPTGVIGEGKFDWNIPLTQKTGTDYKIKIVSVDDGSIVGMSKNNFIIKIKGDIDLDDKITASDALLYLRYAIGQNISPYYMNIGDDVTCDGKITASDALQVLRKAVGQNINLEC